MNDPTLLLNEGHALSAFTPTTTDDGTPQRRSLGFRSSLRLRILSIVAVFVAGAAIALALHLIDQFEEASRVGVMHEGLLMSNFIESGIGEMAERNDVDGIQAYLDRLVATRERNDIEMNVLFLDGKRSYIVASNIPDNIEIADPEEHRELLAALAHREPQVVIEDEGPHLDPDELIPVGPDHPDYYLKPGHRVMNVTTPLLVGERGVGSVNVKISLSELDTSLAVIHKRVGVSIAAAVLVLALVLVSYLEATLFRPLVAIAGRMRRYGLGIRDVGHAMIDRQDEIGVLAREFVSMAQRLNSADAANRRHQENLKRLVLDRTSELVATQDAAILSMASLAEYRDPETGAHIKRTQNYVRLLAERLRVHPRYAGVFDDESIEMLFKSAPLHDIGKVGISDSILLKPTQLTPAEFEQMKEHPRMGRDAILAAEEKLGTNSFLRFAREIAYTHHEKWDGTGYPQGLVGDAIPVSGRLMAIADVYDALISRRCYKPPFPHAEAVAVIRAGRGRHFDPDMVDAFLELEDAFRQIAYQFAESDEERAVVAPYDERDGIMGPIAAAA